MKRLATLGLVGALACAPQEDTTLNSIRLPSGRELHVKVEFSSVDTAYRPYRCVAAVDGSTTILYVRAGAGSCGSFPGSMPRPTEARSLSTTQAEKLFRFQVEDEFAKVTLDTLDRYFFSNPH